MVPYREATWDGEIFPDKSKLKTLQVLIHETAVDENVFGTTHLSGLLVA